MAAVMRVDVWEGLKVVMVREEVLQAVLTVGVEMVAGKTRPKGQVERGLAAGVAAARTVVAGMAVAGKAAGVMGAVRAVVVAQVVGALAEAKAVEARQVVGSAEATLVAGIRGSARGAPEEV